MALFGIGSAKGGGGSGDVYTAYTRNLCDGMEIKELEQKLSVYTPLNDFYRKEANRQYEEGVKNRRNGRA